MTTNCDPDSYVACPSCAVCQDCCKHPTKPAYPFGYHIFEGIKKGNYDEAELAKKIVLLRIPDVLLDETARRGHYPLDNLFRHMTKPTLDGFWEFIALPKGTCIYLSKTGCVINDIKPFECGLYPFYVYKMEMRFDAWCPDVYRLDDTVKVREKVGKYILNFYLYSDVHKDEYYDALQTLKKKYNIPIFTVTKEYLKECEV